MEIAGVLNDSFHSEGSEVDVYVEDQKDASVASLEQDSVNTTMHTVEENSLVVAGPKPEQNDNGVVIKFPTCDEPDINNNSISKQLLEKTTNNSFYKCETCLKSFKKRYRLKNHIETVHNSVRYICEYCAKLYKSKTALDTHKRIKHTHKAIYCCKVCNKNFMDKHLYVGHISKHDG